MSNNSIQDDTSGVQERLMQMLDSVRLDGDPGSKPAVEPVPSSSGTCDNCGTHEDWGKSTWCPSCGYYPKLGRVVVKDLDQASEQEVEEELTPLDLLTRIPMWIYLVVGGCSSILVMDLIIRFSFSEISFRSDIALTQIVVGFTIFCCAHLRAYFMATHSTDGVPFSALFFAPGKIWKPAAQYLPKATAVFCGGSWGMSSVFLAVLIIGLDWNGLFTPNPDVNRPRFNPVKMFMQFAMSFAQKQQPGQIPTGIDPSSLQPGDGLEGAINSFSSEIGVDMLAGGGGGGGGGAIGNLTGAGGGGGLEQSVNGLSQMQDQLPGVNGATGGPIAPGGIFSGPGNGSLVMPTGPGQAMPNTSSINQNSPQTISTESETKEPVKPKLTFPKSPAPETAIKSDLPDRIDYVAYGYTTNAAGDLRAVLLAEMRNGRPYRFASRVHLDATDPAMQKKIEERFEAIRVDRPVVRTPYRARWVKPIVMCHIGYDGKTFDGRLNDAKILSCYELE